VDTVPANFGDASGATMDPVNLIMVMVSSGEPYLAFANVAISVVDALAAAGIGLLVAQAIT
jgi:hypothetical protein